MRHKILISMAIATLFAMSSCSDDDSSSTPNNPPAPPATDLCAGKVAGATCDTGKTCQDEGGKLVCRLAKPNPEVDLCAGKSVGTTCDTGKTCQDEGGKLVCKVPKHEGIDDATQWACGTNICSGSQYCNTKTGTCVDRVEKAVADRDCKASTFVENCDGNKLVYCNPDGKTTVTDCSEDKKGDKTAVCALRRNENYGVCVFQDDRCNAETVGEIGVCIDPDPNAPGSKSYIELFDCERASDGRFYMFKTYKSHDCVGVCLDETQCANTGKECEQNSFVPRCEGDKLLECGTDNKIFGTNCRDFGVGCIVDAQKGAMCDYDNMPKQ